MKVCILGNNLSALTLAKSLVNQKIYVDLLSKKKDFKLNKSGKTEVVFRGSKPPLVRVNVNKMTPGTVPHEIFHTMMRQQFKNDVGLSGSLARNISKTLNGVDWQFGIKNINS